MPSVHDTAHYDAQRSAHAETSIALVLPQALYNALRAHGEETYPHECCGILLGQATPDALTVHDLIRAGNTRADSAHNRYNISPQDLIRAQRDARARSLDIVGFYHSHPDHPAFWSPTDLAEAHWCGCAYVITSIDGTATTPHAHATNSFLLTGTGEDTKSFATQAVQVVGPYPPAG